MDGGGALKEPDTEPETRPAPPFTLRSNPKGGVPPPTWPAPDFKAAFYGREHCEALAQYAETVCWDVSEDLSARALLGRSQSRLIERYALLCAEYSAL